MSRFPINERIKFDMAVEKAKMLDECADRERRGLRSVFRKMLHYAGGNPSWLHKPRPKKSQMRIVRGRSG